MSGLFIAICVDIILINLIMASPITTLNGFYGDNVKTDQY